MAKKRSSSRKGASASRKKAGTSRKRAGAKKKAAPRRKGPSAARAAAGAPLVPRRDGRIDFTELKGRMRAHEEELRKIQNPDEQVLRAIDTLERSRREMSAICGSTMTIP